MIALIIKVTLVLFIGAAAAGVVRRRPAATRHFVWTLTLFATLLLPAMKNVAPQVTVTVPQKMTPPIAAVPSSGHRASSIDWLPLLWAAGTASVLAWSLAGYVGLTRIARSATLIRDGRVRVASSDAVNAPVTWGWLRPIVLLPADADAWPHERRRAALLHELAHVARRDALVQFMATLACAIYWFHPMVWIAARRLRAAAEHASDDRVLAAGMHASDYAAHLLDVAAARRPGALLTLGMASHLEERVRALLDDTRAHGAGSRRMHFAAASLVAAVLVPLGACRTVTATPPVVAPAAESDIATEPAPEWITTSLGRTLRIAGTQNAPAVMHRVEPHYPNDAVVARTQGVVTMQVLIDKSGRVVEVTPMETLPNGLGDAAVAAVKQWTFARASVASEPVPALIDVQINFKL